MKDPGQQGALAGGPDPPCNVFGQFQYPTSPEHADLALKEQALARTAPLNTTPGRYRPSDTRMTFLENL